MSRNDDSIDNQKQQPTWEEVEQTKTPVKKPQEAWLFCYFNRSRWSSTDFVSKRQAPVLGKAVCLEFMTSKVAETQKLVRRANSKNEVSWYGRWLWRWQKVTILGNENISWYEHKGRERNKHNEMQMGGLTWKMARELIPDDLKRKQMLKIEPMYEVVERCPDNLLWFIKRGLTPGLEMAEKYRDSWTNGNQQRMFGKLWDGFMDMSGVKLAGRTIASMARSWDDNSSTDNGGGKKQA